MPLTRDFKETVKARAEKDSALREVLLSETKGRHVQRVGSPWKCKLSEIDAWLHAGGTGYDDVDKGEKND